MSLVFYKHYENVPYYDQMAITLWQWEKDLKAKFKRERIINDEKVEVSIHKSMIPLKEKMKCMRSTRDRALSAMCHYHHLKKWPLKRKSQINYR